MSTEPETKETETVEKVDQPAAQLPTAREALKIEGDVRVQSVSFNLWQGGMVFAFEEGNKTDDGFLPTRQLGQVNVSGETYAKALPLARQLQALLAEELTKTLDQPVQLQQPQR